MDVSNALRALRKMAVNTAKLVPQAPTAPNFDITDLTEYLNKIETIHPEVKSELNKVLKNVHLFNIEELAIASVNSAYAIESAAEITTLKKNIAELEKKQTQINEGFVAQITAKSNFISSLKATVEAGEAEVKLMNESALDPNSYYASLSAKFQQQGNFNRSTSNTQENDFLAGFTTTQTITNPSLPNYQSAVTGMKSPLKPTNHLTSVFNEGDMTGPPKMLSNIGGMNTQGYTFTNQSTILPHNHYSNTRPATESIPIKHNAPVITSSPAIDMNSFHSHSTSKK
jgi:hypothetical protein